jgi:hypothetical protein
MFFDSTHSYIFSPINNQLVVIQPAEFIGELPLSEGSIFQQLPMTDW